MDDLVTTMVGIDLRNTLALQAQQLSALCSRFYLNFSLSVYCRYLGAVTQSRIYNRNMEIINHIIAFTFQAFMRNLFNQYDQVAGYAAIRCRITLAAHAQLHAVTYTCRNIN